MFHTSSVKYKYVSSLQTTKCVEEVQSVLTTRTGRALCTSGCMYGVTLSSYLYFPLLMLLLRLNIEPGVTAVLCLRFSL